MNRPISVFQHFSFSAFSPTTLALTTETFEGVVSDAITHFTDAFGRNAGFQTYGGMTNHYGYDSYGRFSSITNFMPGATVETNVVTYAYLPNSRLLTGHTIGAHTRTVEFEPNRNLVASVANTHGANLVSSFAYTNDALGRRTARADSGGAGILPATNSFTYNPRSELATATFGPTASGLQPSAYSYTYDPIGNRIQAVENSVQTDYIANMLNQYTNIVAGVVTREPTHDDDGNMIFLPSTPGGGAGGEGWYFQWDGENRLATASNATTVVRNTYDAQSRRLRKEVFEDETPTQDIHYFYNGWSLLREADWIAIETPGALTMTRYLWGLDLSQSLQGAGGVGGLLAAFPAQSGNHETHYATSDANGNITEYVDATTGALSARYSYDGFGNTIATSGPLASIFNHRFSSKYLDAELGWYYYGYRFYSPELGRWPSRDPIEEEGGSNLYKMIDNDLAGLFDVLGLSGRIIKYPTGVGTILGIPIGRKEVPAFHRHYMLRTQKALQLTDYPQFLLHLIQISSDSMNQNLRNIVLDNANRELGVNPCEKGYVSERTCEGSIESTDIRVNNGPRAGRHQTLGEYFLNQKHAQVIFFRYRAEVEKYRCKITTICTCPMPGSPLIHRTSAVECDLDMKLTDRYANPMDEGPDTEYDEELQLPLRKSAMEVCYRNFMESSRTSRSPTEVETAQRRLDACIKGVYERFPRTMDSAWYGGRPYWMEGRWKEWMTAWIDGPAK